METRIIAQASPGWAICLLAAAVLGALTFGSVAQATPGIVYSYDRANHLIQASTTTGSSIQYQYDPAGNLLNVSSITPVPILPSQTQSISIGTPGQNAVLALAVSSGDSVVLNFGSISTAPANSSVTISVYDASGTFIASATGSSTQGAQLNLGSPAAGTYTVIVAPQNGATATLQLSPGGNLGNGGADVPLPLWSYALLAALLLWHGQRRARRVISPS